jgi:hypothetical protein
LNVWAGKGDFMPVGAGIFTFAWNEGDDDDNSIRLFNFVVVLFALRIGTYGGLL